MPELPEAETVARGLNTAIRGRRIAWVRLSRADVLHGDPRPLCAMVTGKVVRTVGRRGKRVILELGDSERLVFHLGMSGRLTAVPAETPIEAHTHLQMGFDRGERELRYCDPRRFGGVWYLNGTGETIGRKLAVLGAEPLEIRAATFRRMLQRDKQIKALLLDQQLLSGMGNIYCDEALYKARIHPATAASRIRGERADRLLAEMKATLRAAIRAKGSTIGDYRQSTGEAGGFQNAHQVYGREGQPCKLCGRTIQRIVVAGRSTHVCPNCQRAPRPPRKAATR
jgi:formamidopyrimidine-DNA glycosylase